MQVPTSLGNEYQDTFSYLSTENEDFSQIRKQQKWQEDVAAPLEKGAKVGELVYTLGDKEIGRVAIVTAEGVERADYFDWVQEMWRLWTI